MSNRKKPSAPWLRRTQIPQRGVARNVDQADLLAKVDIPEDEAEVIKEVPAVVDGTRVGTAFIHDDGTVAIMYDKDAPEWALEKIKSTAGEVGYDLGPLFAEED